MSNRSLLAALWRLPSQLALLLVRGYQVLISPMLPPACRFTPSCSHYACACLRDHGFVRGSWLTLRRLSRCHPWHVGGYDPPPPLRGDRGLEHALHDALVRVDTSGSRLRLNQRTRAGD